MKILTPIKASVTSIMNKGITLRTKKQIIHLLSFSFLFPPYSSLGPYFVNKYLTSKVTGAANNVKTIPIADK